MEHAPVPPHERPWRHPSELAADHRAAVVAERPSRRLRALALAGGLVGIAAVGVAVVSLVPPGTRPAQPLAGGPGATQVVMTTILRASDRATPLATPVRLVESEVPGRSTMVLVTPALRTHAVGDTPETGDDVVVRLSDRRTIVAAVADPGLDDGVMVLHVQVDTQAADAPVTMELGTLPDGPDHPVTVLTDEPVRVTLGEVHGVGAESGTAVVDDEGRLLGLCADPDQDPDGFIPIDVALVDATTTSPPRPPR